MNHFWRLVIASALNGDIENIAMHYAAKVIRELFMNSVEAGSMGMSTVPLSKLYEGAARFLEANGSKVMLNSTVESLQWDDESKVWLIETRLGRLTSDYVVLALPFEAMDKLLPQMPSVEGAASLAKQIAQLQHWPICSVHLWFDREITELKHAVLLDREVHWMYNKSKLQPWRKLNGSYVELVVSASRSFAALDRNEAIALTVGELAEFFPAVRDAKVEKAALVKEMRATFGVPPGIDAARPYVDSPWPNLYLAGDWIDTGWPSTMESAARAGHLAAEVLSDEAENPVRPFERDLKPTGLMRFFR
jgi:zeta-carotene desaturase